MSINVMNVKQIFTLFSGEPANVSWLAVITAACREVEEMLLPGTDDTDVRLEFLAAAVAGLHHEEHGRVLAKPGYDVLAVVLRRQLGAREDGFGIDALLDVLVPFLPDDGDAGGWKSKHKA